MGLIEAGSLKSDIALSRPGLLDTRYLVEWSVDCTGRTALSVR